MIQRINYIMNYWSVFTISLIIIFDLLFDLRECNATVHQVFTYKNTSTSLGQLVTSSTLQWETYDVKDSKQLQYAVEGGKYISEDEHYPIYICRVTIDGVATSGHTEKIMQNHVCIASHYKNNQYKNFDILINKGHLGKISWRAWRKFGTGVPVGAIRIGSREDAYIARHKVIVHHNHQMINENPDHFYWGSDYNLGRLDPVGLGKIKVMDNEHEKHYDEGEILVETEPYRYELRDIRLDHIRLDIQENITELASGILENCGDKFGLVEMVLSYDVNNIQYWGSHEGVARGLPTKIYEKNNLVPIEINWGLKNIEKRFETKSVNTMLWPGTALNVTINGNYVTLESPYSAKLFAYYYGSDETVSRKIMSTVRKSYLKNVKFVFSSVYWISNGTAVPTYMTTTTTTTTPSSINIMEKNYENILTDLPVMHHEHENNHLSGHLLKESSVLLVGDNIDAIHSGPDTIDNSLLNSRTSNEIFTSKPENLAEKQQKPVLASIGMKSAINNSSILHSRTIERILYNYYLIIILLYFFINFKRNFYS